eukprot:159709_1
MAQEDLVKGNKVLLNWFWKESLTDYVNEWKEDIADYIHDGVDKLETIKEELLERANPILFKNFQLRYGDKTRPLYRVCSDHIESLYSDVVKETIQDIPLDAKEEPPIYPEDHPICTLPPVYRCSLSNGIYGSYMYSIDTLTQMQKQCEPFKRICTILSHYKPSKVHMIRIHIEPDNDKLRQCKKRKALSKGNPSVAACNQYQNIGKKIWDYINSICAEKCHLEQCEAMKEHYKHKNRDNAHTYINESEEHPEDVVFKQCLDTIHVYFFHSTVRCGVRYFQTTVEDEKWMNRLNHRVMGTARPNGLIRRQRSLPYIELDQKELDSELELSDGLSSSGLRNAYIGKKDDDEWWQDIDSTEIASVNQDDNQIYVKLIQNMGVFRWQNPHGFDPGTNHEIAHYKPKHKDVKQEILNNGYYDLPVACWNLTLKNAQTFKKNWTSKTIRSYTNSLYHDQITGHKREWTKNEAISLIEIMVLKMYTDYDRLQAELKKCFHFETMFDIIKEKQIFEQEKYVSQYKIERERLKHRLETFYDWRCQLLSTLHKFGTRLHGDNNMIFYHGVNAKMLIKATQTLAFSGPLSTTRSYHVARSFATTTGMVLSITSQFPRLNYCNAFDVSLISNFPEEQEWLVGFMYVRLLKVRTNKIVEDVNDYDQITESQPFSSIGRSIFFAMQLFQQQIFSANEQIARIQAQFLKVHRLECCECKENPQFVAEHKEYQDWDMSKLCDPLCAIAHGEDGIRAIEINSILEQKSITDEQIPDINRMKRLTCVLWAKFEESRTNLTRVKFDIITDHLKRFFMEPNPDNEVDILTNKVKLVISLKQIVSIYPAVEEIHFLNAYKLTDHVLRELISLIEQNVKTLRKIVFLYFDYQGEGMPTNDKIFKNPNDLDPQLQKRLKELHWIMKHNENGKSGYKIRLFRQ